MWRWAVLAISAALSMGAVLFVNDGFGLLESERSYDPPPLVTLLVNDPRNKLEFVTLETNLVKNPHELQIVAKQITAPPTCDEQPFYEFRNRVSLRPVGYHLVEGGEELQAFPGRFTLSDDEEFAVFPDGAWNDGYGRLQIKMLLQVMTGRCMRSTKTGASFSASECGFPAFVRVISPSHKYDVLSSIPATIDIGDDIATVYSWSSRLSAPTSDRPGSIASAELRLVSKHRNAIAQLTTIVGSAVFGAVVSIWIGLIAPPPSPGEQPRPVQS